MAECFDPVKGFTMVFHFTHQEGSNDSPRFNIVVLEINYFNLSLLLNGAPHQVDLFLCGTTVFRKFILEFGHEFHHFPIHENVTFLYLLPNDQPVKAGAPAQSNIHLAARKCSPSNIYHYVIEGFTLRLMDSDSPC